MIQRSSSQQVWKHPRAIWECGERPVRQPLASLPESSECQSHTPGPDELLLWSLGKSPKKTMPGRAGAVSGLTHSKWGPSWAQQHSISGKVALHPASFPQEVQADCRHLFTFQYWWLLWCLYVLLPCFFQKYLWSNWRSGSVHLVVVCTSLTPQWCRIYLLSPAQKHPDHTIRNNIPTFLCQSMWWDPSIRLQNWGWSLMSDLLCHGDLVGAEKLTAEVFNSPEKQVWCWKSLPGWPGKYSKPATCILWRVYKDSFQTSQGSLRKVGLEEATWRLHFSLYTSPELNFDITNLYYFCN